MFCAGILRLFCCFSSTVRSWSSAAILHCHAGTSAPHCCWFLAGQCSLSCAMEIIKQFICSILQPNTEFSVCRLFQMVWENGCTVIVMMTALVEDGEKQCERYWPDEGSSLYHIYEVHFLFHFYLSHRVQKIILQTNCSEHENWHISVSVVTFFFLSNLRLAVVKGKKICLCTPPSQSLKILFF